MTNTVRCAIYTRKSTEDGLEKEFNTLEAQREAGSSYIKSQKHQGWIELAKRYDDGGFSGGSLERPALRKLLEDVATSGGYSCARDYAHLGQCINRNYKIFRSGGGNAGYDRNDLSSVFRLLTSIFFRYIRKMHEIQQVKSV